MNVAWMYLDKEAAAIKALKDFERVEKVIESYQGRLEEARTRMLSSRTPVLSHAHASSAGASTAEDVIAETIDTIDAIKENYRQAVAFMQWFLPAWNALDDDERSVMTAFYQHVYENKTAMLYDVSAELGVERASVYRLKDKAVKRLAQLLYGKP